MLIAIEFVPPPPPVHVHVTVTVKVPLAGTFTDVATVAVEKVKL